MNIPDHYRVIDGVWLAMQDGNRLVGHLNMNVKAPSRLTERFKDSDHLDMEEAI